MKRRIFYVVVIDTPQIMGIVGLVEEIDWKPWVWIDQDRSVVEIERSAIKKGHMVTYHDAHTLPGWAFEKLMTCVVARYKQSFELSSAFEVDWEVFHRIVVYPKEKQWAK